VRLAESAAFLSVHDGCLESRIQFSELLIVILKTNLPHAIRTRDGRDIAAISRLVVSPRYLTFVAQH
jgi:hypothetical protein